MSLRFDRVSVIDQIAAALREGLSQGHWTDRLPSERGLCEELRVGRNTLRAALRRLAQEKLIEVVPGQGARVLSASKSRPKKETHVGLLCPLPLEQLRPRQALWIDGLRARLGENGSLLRVVHGPQYFRGSPGSALQWLLDRENFSCCVLVLSTKSCQQWFQSNGIPCVVAGTCHPKIELPYVDVHYRALCYHAATTLLRQRHRSVVYLSTTPEAAGDVLSEEGFLEGMKSVPDSDGRVVRNTAGRNGIVGAVHRLMSRNNPPTAIIVKDSYWYLTVLTALNRMKLRVPEDVSLISREADTFLNYVVPQPACYVDDSGMFARKLARVVDKLLQDPHARPAPVLMIPKLSPGGSMTTLEAKNQ